MQSNSSIAQHYITFPHPPLTSLGLAWKPVLHRRYSIPGLSKQKWCWNLILQIRNRAMNRVSVIHHARPYISTTPWDHKHSLA